MFPKCFNPCFCGTGARTLYEDSASLSDAVSILVFVELALEPCSVTAVLSQNVVSILVFVELALELWRIKSGFDTDISFNPCFCGTGARTRRGVQ